MKIASKDKTSSNVLVPISLKVMLVGSLPDVSYYAKNTYAFENLEDAPLGAFVENDMMSLRTENRKGAHLHWSLSDGLTQGVQTEADGESELKFPAVPNRWIVTRLWTSPDDVNGIIQTRSWMVESDALMSDIDEENYNLGSVSYPYLDEDEDGKPYQSDDNDQPYRYLGRSYPVEVTPDSPDDIVSPLLAVAPGNPYYAAYYPDCGNVFGFYDDMKDVSGTEIVNVNITYNVVGWYSNASDDVLLKVNSAKDCVERYGWKPDDSCVFPANTICHGMACDIAWKTKQDDYTNSIPVRLNAPDLAVGNSTAEAISALKEWKSPKGNNQERMMNLLFQGANQILTENNGLIHAEDMVHEMRFGYQRPVTNIELKSQKDQNGERVSYDLIRAVNEVNQLYETLQDTKYELSHKQEKVYDLWYKYILKGQKIRESEDDKKYRKQYAKEINSIAPEIEETRKKIQSLQSSIVTKRKDVEQIAGEEYRVVETNQQEYWKPAEPVLLLSGLQRNYTCGADARFSDDNTLFCRSDKNLISQFTLEPIENVLDSEAVLDGKSLLTGNIPSEVMKLLQEVVLISTSFSMNIAKNIARQKNITDQNRIAVLKSAINKLQTVPFNGKSYEHWTREELSSASGFNGIFPEKQGVDYWTQPWLPLMMQWDISFYSDSKVLQETPVLDNWKLEGNDYVCKAPISSLDKFQFSGKCILTPQASDIISEKMRTVLGNEELANTAMDMNVVSQTLSGFQEEFLMREYGLTMPVYDLPDKNTTLAKKVRDLMDGYIYEKPKFNTFFAPIRAGYLELDIIQVIDEFGQVQMINNPPGAAVTEDMRDNDSVFQKRIMLPPRFVQDTRLYFDWLTAAENKSCSKLREDDSICGWILPNHMEHSIMFFDATGALLGSLENVMVGISQVVWKCPPAQGGGTTEVPTAMNQDLYHFIQAILEVSRGEGAVKNNILLELLSVIDSALWTINPASQYQNNGLGLYVGRPLVLTKGLLRLDQKGPKAEYKVMEKSSNDDDISENKSTNQPDAEKLNMPVYIGRKRNHGDGLIGFFVNQDYVKFHVVDSETTLEHAYFSDDNSILLTAAKNDSGKELTFLMDPMACVDFISGMLPVKEVKLNDHQVGEALKKLFFTLFSAPVLVNRNDMAIPYPETEGRDWTWLTMSKQNGVPDEKVIHHTTESAYFPENGFEAIEGWLKMKLNK